MGAGSVFLRRGGGTIDRGRRQARESHTGDQDAGHPLYTRRRELSVVRNQAAATSRGVLYGAARGAVEPRNA